MGLKVRRGGLAAFITGCCVLGIVITVSQLNENKPLNGYVDGRQNTIVTTAAPATKPPRDPDMQLYTDNTVGLSLQVPLKWNRVIKGGEVTFIESDTAAYVRVSVGAYPKGLAGKEIPLIARIICVADSFDTMNSNRVYRKKLTKECIINEIETNKGRQFDPEIADVMLKLLRSSNSLFDL